MKEDTLILTCKLGNEIINCYDGTHNKEQLKKWASKKILLCPACGKPYEYCHGEVKTPYFRHMDKNECEDKYSESETEEHLIGKRDLFEWIKKQSGVTNAVLEAWIPETKQRPDIMFEYDGKKYVIEYQCSPIATEYIERHELYKASGIIDIWICGTKKYLKKRMREKYLEQYSIGFYNSDEKEFIIGKYTDLNKFINCINIKKNIINFQDSYNEWCQYYSSPLDNFCFSIENFFVPYFLSKTSFNASINIHQERKRNKESISIQKVIKSQLKFESILEKYCANLKGIFITKYEISNGHSKYKIADALNSNNESSIFFNGFLDFYSQLKSISECIKYVLDRRKYLYMLIHLERIFSKKLHGEYDIEYKDFGNGEYIDIKYNDFTLRFLIRNLCMEAFIHDFNGYMRKNYEIFQNKRYHKYNEIVLDVIKYANIIFDNNTKVRTALNNIGKLSNRNWLFHYTISPFNLVEIKLYPIDNENNKWDSIGTLKINANLDKKINLEFMTEDEIFEYIKDFFYKRLVIFFKTGIKSYYTDDERLIICHEEVRDN